MSDSFYITISNQIEGRIRSGELGENQRLPSERQLSTDYNVSRAVVREALRVLDEKGLIRVVVGKGNYVRLPKDEYLSDKFKDIIDYHNITKDDVIQARQVVEAAIGTLILDSLKPEELGLLESLYTQMDGAIEDVVQYSLLDAEFHMQMAMCTGNQLLQLIASILNKVTDRKLLFENDNVKLRENAQREHRRILDAFRQKDRTMLQSAISEHIYSFGKHIRM